MREEDTQFDILREWASLSDSALGAIYSDEAGELLSFFVSRLGSSEEMATPINADTYVSLIRKMHARLTKGSRLLGETILKATEAKGIGETRQAISYFQDFVQGCPSECYKEVANIYLKELRANGI